MMFMVVLAEVMLGSIVGSVTLGVLQDDPLLLEAANREDVIQEVQVRPLGVSLGSLL